MHWMAVIHLRIRAILGYKEKAYRKIEETVHTSFFYSNDEGKGGLGKDGKIARDFEAKEFFRYFSLGEKLGQGATGKVFKATLKCTPEGEEPTPYAVKRVRRWGLRERAKKALLQEVSILHKLVHKNVVDIYQFYPKDPQYSYMVLEYMAGGELFERIVKKMSYNEKEARDMCVILIDAIGYCHGMGIVHRDIKPSNILLTSKEDDATIKLADFGFACSVAKKKVITKCGTQDFMAPEILLGKPHDTSVDMWSIGLVIYILLGGRHPFYERNTTKMFIRIAAADFVFGDNWTNTTEHAKDFISRLLTANPDMRMTAAEARGHPWLHATGQSLASVDLGKNLDQIKIFQAKIKLRAMIKTVLLAQRLISSGKFSDNFVMGKKLGEGAFATVFKATALGKGGPAAAAAGEGLPPPPTEFAVKRITREGLKDEDKQSVYDEARILREMTHPNVVHIERFYDNDPEYYYMVLELMAGGELFDRIVQKTFYNEEEARNLCRVLLGGIKYMHGRDIVHRDLKPENLLLASPSDDLSIRLADFGFACSVREGFVKDMCGTPAYVAPEILNGKAYGTSVDMWSTGVIIYILLCGYPPFSDENQTRMYRKIKVGRFKFHTKYWSQVSEEAKDLIKKLLIVDQTTRMTAADALDHPWLSTEGPSMTDHDLGEGLKELRLFNARRKLRAAIQSILLTRRVATGMGLESLIGGR